MWRTRRRRRGGVRSGGKRTREAHVTSDGETKSMKSRERDSSEETSRALLFGASACLPGIVVCPASNSNRQDSRQMAAKKIICTAKAAAAVGPYSQAVRVERTLYLSGCIGLHADKSELVSGGVVPETRQALDNMKEILNEAGATFDNVVKCTVMLQNMTDFSAVNDVYKTYFSKNFPARVCYEVAGLPKGAQVEIDAIAHI